MKPLGKKKILPAILLLSACSWYAEGEAGPSPEPSPRPQPTSVEVVTQAQEEAPLPSSAPVIKESKQEEPPKEPSSLAVTTPAAPLRGVTGEGGVPQIPQGAFSFVLDAGGYHVVLTDEPQEAWGVGEPRLVFSGEMIIVRREIDLGQVTPLYGGWLGRGLQLYAKEAPVCEATVQGFALVGQVYPDETLEAELRSFDGTEKSLAALSSKAWELTGEDGQRFLTAELVPTRGHCTGAVWARDASLPAPRLARAVPVAGPLKDTALAAFRSLPAYLAIQEEYNRSPDVESGIPWEEFDGVEPTVLAFQEPGTGALLLSVSASVGYEYGFFEGSLWAVWQVVGSASRPHLRLLGEPSNTVYSVPELAIDVDADGQWEFLEEQWLIRKLGKSFDTWTEVEELYSPYEEDYGC